ncbi:MAG: flagellar L-ring protein precursor FlgH [Myxococcota bacterium]|jgi:flagellar L-ring protein precursor FlgH
MKATVKSALTGLPVLTMALVTTLGMIAISGCNPQLGEYSHRKRIYEPPVAFPQATEQASTGSIWTPSMRGNYLFTDQRARSAGDIVTVVVREEADARRGATTKTGRESKMSLALTGLFSVLKELKPDLLGAEMLGFESGNEFNGQGSTTRTERLHATVPATVMKVLPNGNLFVEGTRTILVNREEHRFYISGVVRPADISDENMVESERIAEAEIEFNGRGVISDKQGPGALIRAMDQYSPF